MRVTVEKAVYATIKSTVGATLTYLQSVIDAGIPDTAVIERYDPCSTIGSKYIRITWREDTDTDGQPNE